jgi:hypothetical protein
MKQYSIRKLQFRKGKANFLPNVDLIRAYGAGSVDWLGIPSVF